MAKQSCAQIVQKIIERASELLDSLSKRLLVSDSSGLVDQLALSVLSIISDSNSLKFLVQKKECREAELIKAIKDLQSVVLGQKKLLDVCKASHVVASVVPTASICCQTESIERPERELPDELHAECKKQIEYLEASVARNKSMERKMRKLQNSFNDAKQLILSQQVSSHPTSSFLLI